MDHHAESERLIDLVQNGGPQRVDVIATLAVAHALLDITEILALIRSDR